MKQKKRIVILTGAGISAESGIKTFRDGDGLWEGHDIHEVATPEAWYRNPALVLDFYNQRRKQLFEVEPNAAHHYITKLQELYDVYVITQNVDDLHERAGNNNVIHLHGELRKVRSTKDQSLIYDWHKDVTFNDKCGKGSQLRPHIVWFGEDVPELSRAALITQQADVLVVIGTSMQVYPAANLIYEVALGTPIYFIDPEPNASKKQFENLTVIAEKATVGMEQLVEILT
ncbi:SIR2 family NAD-dependent protein deacylase [Urechidicola vernalis]|uniref:NAD-dependent protein deacylase n=1 Tax=Urechidicola vernalis TaxID=3075600 RepID=A0ABU2Y1G8_9FLAO|nr:NAD-dependent deacylase [Urechidicola sp. P050]MDT0552054.1 NAD-dependent deacylase [Urechidicola sp. P050]